MPRRPNSFARALSDAEKRLEKALAERKEALEKVSALAIEIPSLERTIQALKLQMDPKAIPVFIPQRIPGVIKEVMATLPDGSDLKSIVGPQDLTGMGSIPALTEDITLPDDFEVKK